MTASPKLACDAATLQLRHGERHAVPVLVGSGGASSTSGEKRKEVGLFSEVSSCRTDGIMSSNLANSTVLITVKPL